MQRFTIKKLISLGIVLTLLQGCVGAFVAGAAAGGLVVYDRRDLKTIEADQAMRFHIHKRIVKDPLFNNSHIVVSSFNRIVLLAGETPQPSLRALAQRIAQKEPGVKRVYNEITISSPTSNLTQSSDVWITTKVKTQMLATRDLNSGQIKVVTENGTVFLLGHVSHDQARLAVDVARRVDGVQKVVKVFEYTD